MLRAALLYALATLAVVSPAWANDRWDLGTLNNDDGPVNNPNELVHGDHQIHDLQATGSPADEDWLQIRVRSRHSYEARVSGISGVFWSTIDGPVCLAGACARLDRVDAGGTVLQAAAMLEGSSRAAGVRWVAVATGGEYLRVTGPAGTALGSSDQYEVEFFDTTYAVPRFNNSSSQTTVLVIQNLRATSVAGNIDFYDAGGVLVHAEPLVLNAGATVVLNTAALPGAAGQSGSVLIAQTGGWGALAGKAVALEPATGFTFDTPLEPVPR
jgi:hypothetical protein